MNVFGWLLLAIGIGLTLAGLGMEGSVAAADGLGRIHNIGLLAQKLTLVIVGGFAFLSGIVLIGFGALSKPPPAAAKSGKTAADPFAGQY